MKHSPWLLLLSLLALDGAYANTIYRYVDASGKLTYSDRRMHDGYVPLVKSWKGWQEAAPPANLREGVTKYRPLVKEAAQRHALSAALISAVIHAESYYNPLAVSKKGAVGLMQLMPGTASRYGVRDRQDPKQNVEGGTRYLRDLLVMFDNQMELALAAYNAGENAVKRRGNTIPPYPETRHYVKKVLALYERYRLENI